MKKPHKTTPKTRTPEEIQDMILKLENEKDYVPEHSFFGDHNWEAIDLQISILREEIMDEDELYDKLDEDEISESTLTTGLDAFQWLNFDIDTLVEERKVEPIKPLGKRKPCRECPFRKASASGYLGNASYKPQEFLDSMEQTAIPCHLSVNWEKSDGTKEAEKTPCIGSLKFLNNCMKMPRDQKYLTMRMQATKDSTVFNTKKEFIDHHKPKKNGRN